ncbi:MAG: low molecular weight protein arginine phosphatase [Sporomusaceae bacterium]|nr:low molecular weight protein arginine phosphatase [Sporomusaceae bacterium]
MLQILILCTGNTCRSPMAQLLLQERIKEAEMTHAFTVKSAGLAAFPGQAASAGAAQAMKSRGIDAKMHRSRLLTEDDLVSADLILTMTQGHKNQVLQLFPKAKSKVFTLAEYTGNLADVSDPFGGDLAEYERCARMLSELVDLAWEKLQTSAGKNQ